MLRAVTLRVSLLVVLVAPLAGCGESKPPRPPRQPTRGTLSYNGKPPNGAVVQLWPVPVEKADWRTIKPAARVGTDGAFEINTYELGDGAVVGEYAVTVLWTGENPDLPRPDLFQGRYSDPKRPVATVTVREGENTIPPIQLKGPPVNPNDGWVDPVTNQKS